MHLDGNHIIKFAMKRWELTKKTIAEDYLLCSQSALSRKEPPRIDPQKYYEQLFDVGYQGSAASVKKENQVDLLNALIDYLVKENCQREANLISTKYKKGSKYREIILEVLKRANTQPSKSKCPDKAENSLPDNSEVEITSHIKNIPSDEIENKVTIRSEPLSTISGWDGSSTALDVLLRPLPRSMKEAAQTQKLRNRQRKENP